MTPGDIDSAWTVAGTLRPMGGSGEKHKGRDHLPKLGTDPNREMAQERAAVEENLGLRPGGTTARIVGVVLVIAAVVAILALVVLNQPSVFNQPSVLN